jgi:hypothetical protein
MSVQIQLRRGTASQWSTTNPILAQGEVGFETDTGKVKIGNGTNTWTSLNYFSGLSVSDVRSYFSQGTGVTIVNGQISIGQAVGTNNNVVFNTVQHNGLAFTSGTNIDQLLTFTKSLTLTTDWQDTGIKNTDLATGSYIVQLYANDLSAGGTNINEYYSGTMSWYSGATDSSLELPTDEIVLHRAGGSGSAGLYLRTYRSPSNNADALKLQIYSNQANASSANYIFKFRRLI